MDGKKGALTSKTVWGGIITLAAAAAGMAGYTFSEADQASATEAIVSLIAAGGAIISIVGRVVAKDKIGKN